jgi:glycosyltransferase involved in cell wall biosynthesis
MPINSPSDYLDVTVSIMSFNRAQFLAETIKSVLAQSKRPQNIFVFDNGSCDDVRQVVAGFEGSGVVWKGTDQPGTPVWNFQRAINAADTKYVYVMHDDDRLCSTFLEQQVGFLDGNPTTIAVACNGYVIDTAGSRTGGFIGPKCSSSIDMFSSGSSVALLYAEGSWLTFASVVYKADPVKNLPIKKEFGKVFDAVFLCDLADYGTIAYQNTPLYEYRIHAGQDSQTFPLPVLQKLEEFLFAKVSGNACSDRKLRSSIRKISSDRIIDKIKIDFKNRNSLWCFLNDVRAIRFRYFSLLIALRYLIALVKRFFGRI